MTGMAASTITGLLRGLAALRVALTALAGVARAHPILLLVSAAALIVTAWEPITQFFEDMWKGQPNSTSM